MGNPGRRPDPELAARGGHDHRQQRARPDTAVMGTDALSAFFANAKVAEQLNKLHIVVGGISPTAPEGIGTAQFIGTLFRPYVRHLRLCRELRRRGDERAQADDRDAKCPDRVLEGPATTSYGA